MTRELRDYILNTRSKGLIFVSAFDNWTNTYLSSFDSIYQRKDKSVVRHKRTGKEFDLIEVNENIYNKCRGRKSSHIIIDHRLSDEVIREYILPLTWGGVNRKVEIF
jgi:hypothetical protein